MAKTPTGAAKAAAKSTSAKPAARKSAAPKKPRAAKAAVEDAIGKPATARFTKAIDEARAGAKALGSEAQSRAAKLGSEARTRADSYREQLTAKSADWAGDAKELAGQAKVRAGEMALDGKARASDAIASLGGIVADSAATIDDKLGTRYGDYARTAARTMQETAAKVDAKDLGELGNDAKAFVRKSPAVALGIAAVAGFILSRLFRSNDEA